MISVIIACEIAFWVFVVGGLAVRYVLRRPKAGAWILLCAPVVDVVLLIVTGLSVRSGHEIGIGHALAPIYLGFSVTYGHRMVAWADRHFAYRFAGGPKPIKLTGAAYTRLCWGDVARTAGAALITWAVTAILISMAAPGVATGSLEQNYRWMTFIAGLDVIWAVSYTIWPRKDEHVNRGHGWSERRDPAPPFAPASDNASGTRSRRSAP